MQENVTVGFLNKRPKESGTCTRHKAIRQRIAPKKVITANLRTIHYIHASEKDAARRFWTYIDTLVGREKVSIILDECTGREVGDLGMHLTVYLKETFSSE